MTTIKWNNAAFMTLDAPTAFPTHSREDPTAAGMSDMLYAWDEAKKAREEERRQRRAAAARIGVRAFTWEQGQ